MSHGLDHPFLKQASELLQALTRDVVVRRRSRVIFEEEPEWLGRKAMSTTMATDPWKKRRKNRKMLGNGELCRQ